jgi:cytochrome c peroxidase
VQNLSTQLGKEETMNKVALLVFLVLAAVTVMALAEDQTVAPMTQVGTHSLGPQKICPLPPAPIPPDNPQTARKILLGKQLYFDPRLSKDNSVSCATCHDPAKGWSDAGPTSKGINGQLGGRRSPPVSNAAYLPLQFWDGRAPSLEEQAKGPIQNPIEMGSTHDVMIRTVSDIPGYVEEFKDVFGDVPITVDEVAQAIASFERTVVTTDSPFDRYAKGDDQALSCLEKKGLEIFNGKGHCTACHWGGNFTDGRFHNLGVQPVASAQPDEGRFAITKVAKDMGAFKTPTVRDVALRAPYLHNGSEKTLEALVELYNRGGGGDDANLDPLMVPLGLSKAEIKALVAFMTRAMTSLNPEVSNVQPPSPSELPR